MLSTLMVLPAIAIAPLSIYAATVPSLLASTPSVHLSSSSSLVASAPTLDLTSSTALLAATHSSLSALLSYYVPNNLGVYDQTETPWHESGMIWGGFMDFTKWSGDGSFVGTVGEALGNASFGSTQDFLDGAQGGLQSTLLGKWNDDILWPAQALIAASEIFGGPDSVQPILGDSSAGLKWITGAQKTYDEAWQQWSDECGGGIFWSRDRNSASKNYKSIITNLEFVSQGARLFLQTGNTTTLTLAERTLDWVLGSSGLADPSSGKVFDGMNVGACSTFAVDQWSYNYGELLGALAWMHKATSNSTYLTLSSPFLTVALSTFFPAPSSILAELCENPLDGKAICNRDQQGFKSILARNLGYLYRETTIESDKGRIRDAMSKTVAALVQHCDASWNCAGNLTVPSAPTYNPRSQHVASAILVGALAIFTDTSTGLLPTFGGSISAVGTGTGQGAGTKPGAGAVVSTSLSGAGRVGLSWMGVVGSLVGLGVSLVMS